MTDISGPDHDLIQEIMASEEKEEMREDVADMASQLLDTEETPPLRPNGLTPLFPTVAVEEGGAILEASRHMSHGGEAPSFAPPLLPQLDISQGTGGRHHPPADGRADSPDELGEIADELLDDDEFRHGVADGLPVPQPPFQH